MPPKLVPVPLDDALGRDRRRRRDLPAGRRPLHEATAAYGARTDAGRQPSSSAPSSSRTPTSPLVRGFGGPLSVVVTGGAGQIGRAAVGLCAKLGLNLPGSRSRCATRTTWRGNARRVVAALRDVDTDVPVYVELPHVGNTVLVVRGRRRGGRGRAAAEVPHRWAGGGGVPGRPRAGPLDRRGAGPRDAVQVHGRPAQRGPAHRRRRDRASSTTASSTCCSRPGCSSTAPRWTTRSRCWSSATARRWRPRQRELDLAGARRWFTSFGSCSVAEPLADLHEPPQWRAGCPWVGPHERLRAGPPAVRRLLGRRRAAPGRGAVRRRGGRLGRRPARRDRAAGVRRGARSTRSWRSARRSGGRPARRCARSSRAAASRCPSRRSRCTCPSRSPTTSTSTPRSTTRPTSAGSSGPTASR